MIEDVLPDSHQTEPRVNSNKTGANIQLAQEIIHRFLLDLVKQRHPETALQEFKRLFINYADTVNPEPLIALGKIISNNDEEAFRNILKQSCSIIGRRPGTMDIPKN
jgi:hypothetical protein